MSPVSTDNSRLIYDALKACGVRLVSALPETWLVHLIRMAEDDPEMILVRLAKEEEGVGISAGAHLAGVTSAMLMQNHGFLAAVNGIVSCAQLYRIPLLMLISFRGEFGERDPWQTEGGGVTEDVLRALNIPFEYLDHPVARRAPDREGADAGGGVEQAGGAAVVPRPDVGGARVSAVPRRLDVLEAVYDRLESRVVVTIMGAVAAELQSIGHRPNFFYLQHAMGLASSLGLGIALSRPDRQVVVLDGDGSVLMNLGGLTTLARYRPRNLVHVVFDNESLLSVGGFPTATSTGSDLAGIAAAAGVPRTATVRTLDDFVRAFDEALAANDLTTLVAKVEAVGPSAYVTELTLLENRFEFQRHLRETRGDDDADCWPSSSTS